MFTFFKNFKFVLNFGCKNVLINGYANKTRSIS